MKATVSLHPHIRPDPVAVEIRRIGSLIEANKLTLAQAESLRLLKANPRRPDVHNILGVTYVRQKQLKKAVSHFEFAVKAEPANSHYLNNLGRLYVDLRLIELARPFLHKALAIDPNLTQALLAIGNYYNSVGKAELALPYLDRLNKMAPQDNGAKLELADSLDVLGRREEADKLYRELLRTESHAVHALYYFSRNESLTDKPALLSQTKQLLLCDNITDQQRSTLHTALGFIYEREENYSLAFCHFEKANQLRSDDFEIEQYRTWVDGVIELLTADLFRERANIGSPSALPVLVVGMPRSGTTLAEQIIASHSQAGGAGELTRIGLFAKKLSYSPQRDITKFLQSFDALGARNVREMGANYVDLLRFHAPEAERVVDKLPHNFETLGFAALICSNVRIIHCSRNPVDTCWSCFKNRLNDRHSYRRNLTHLGLYYREYKRLMDHWKAVLPMQIHELNYERLTVDFENEVRKMIQFLGLPWDDACLKFFEGGRTVRTFSRQQVRNPVYRSSVGRWRHYEKELEPLLSALGDLA